MPIIGWIRDLFGIQKDMYETKKTRLEIEKIEDEKREKIIFPATLKDVERYDPKVEAIRTMERAAREAAEREGRFRRRQESAGERAAKSGGCLVSSLSLLLLTFIFLLLAW